VTASLYYLESNALRRGFGYATLDNPQFAEAMVILGSLVEESKMPLCHPSMIGRLDLLRPRPPNSNDSLWNLYDRHGLSLLAHPCDTFQVYNQSFEGIHLAYPAAPDPNRSNAMNDPRLRTTDSRSRFKVKLPVFRIAQNI
jgi:hypothetical protein